MHDLVSPTRRQLAISIAIALAVLASIMTVASAIIPSVALSVMAKYTWAFAIYMMPFGIWLVFTDRMSPGAFSILLATGGISAVTLTQAVSFAISEKGFAITLQRPVRELYGAVLGVIFFASISYIFKKSERARSRTGPLDS